MKAQAFARAPQPLRVLRVLSAALFVTLLALSSTTPYAQATATNQTAPQVPGKPGAPDHPTGSVATGSAPKARSKPLWQDLSPAQQQSLKPLAGKWASLSEERKRKWLAVSKNYPSLPPAEQVKLHSRMAEWVSLSQQQRTQARLNFAETNQLPPAEKAASWQTYQALSPEEKQKLAAKAPTIPTGVAVVKPAPPQKLAAVPAPRKNSPQDAKHPDSPSPVNRQTLLPRHNPLTESAPAQ